MYIEPGPTPTLMPSAPASSRSRVPYEVRVSESVLGEKVTYLSSSYVACNHIHVGEVFLQGAQSIDS